MTLRHLFDVSIKYPKIQNVLYFLFCFTLRPNVVDANSEVGGSLTLPWLRVEQLPFCFLVVLLGSFLLKQD